MLRVDEYEHFAEARLQAEEPLQNVREHVKKLTETPEHTSFQEGCQCDTCAYWGTWLPGHDVNTPLSDEQDSQDEQAA